MDTKFWWKDQKAKREQKKGGWVQLLFIKTYYLIYPKRPPWIDAWHVVSHATRATHHHPISAHTFDVKLYTVKGEKWSLRGWGVRTVSATHTPYRISLNLVLIHLKLLLTEVFSFPSMVNTLYEAILFFLFSSGSLDVAKPLPLLHGPLKLYEFDLSWNPNSPA